MKEYSYEVEQSWEQQPQQQRRAPPPPPPAHPQVQPIPVEHHHSRQRHQRHQRHSLGEDAAMDADASSMSETTSESGVSDLETSMTDFRCTCCPYGYHLDTDFMKFLDDMYGPDVLRTLKKIERKRHDVRRRLINEQPLHTIPVQLCSQQASATSSFDNEILRETLLELDRIVEKDIKDLEAECHRHASTRSGHTHQQRSRSVDSRRHLRAPPRPPTSSSTAHTAGGSGVHSSSSRTAEEHRLYERRMQTEKTITTRTHSAPRLNLVTSDTTSSLRKLDTTGGGPITMLYKIPPPPFSRSSSSSSLSTETTLRVSSPEPDDREPLKPLYITEITVPPKARAPVRETTKTKVVTITDKTEIERRNREIERLEQERRTLLSEKELLLKEIDRYKHRPVTKIPEQKATSTSVLTDEHIEQIHTHHAAASKRSTREVAMQHIVEDDKPPPLPPKQRQQRDVAISHTTEYDDDDEKQAEIVRRKLEEIKNFYTERIHILEDRILEQEKDIDRLSEPKKQRHVNTQCQPLMQDRALVTDTFRSVRDVGLTCNLQPTTVPHRDVNVQCSTDQLIGKRDVWIEALPDVPMKRDVAIGVSIGVTSDKHLRDVATHVNFDLKPEIRQRDVAVMITPEPILKQDRASNTQTVQTREFAMFANTIEPPKPPPKPSMRQAATDTHSLVTQKETASGPDEIKRARDTATDTFSLVSLNDRGSGNDVPPELFARHVSTDTRTLVTTRDNYSFTLPVVQPAQFDAQTQSIATLQRDASSNTLAPAEQRHAGIQVIQEQPSTRHTTTSTEQDVFHRTGHLRHNVSNTDSRHLTDSSTGTEQHQSYDFETRHRGQDDRREFIERQETTWTTSHQQRVPTSSYERSFQTDLHDTKREVGYMTRPSRQQEESIEEQRQEIITFRLPQQPPPQITTEETYETTVTTERQPTYQQRQMKHDAVDTTMITSETTEWTRSLGTSAMKTSASSTSIKEDKGRSRSPEELVEESYEVISTLAKPRDAEFLITSSTPRATTASSTATAQRYLDLSAGKTVSSEDDSSYCEEWTVTEAKRKHDGQTVQTIIDRGGHHRYSINTEDSSTSAKDTTTDTSTQVRHHSGESSSVNRGTQIREFEETIQTSPTTVRKTAVYEAHRTLGTGQPTLSATSSGFRTVSPSSGISSTKRETTEEGSIEEKYEVTISSYDDSGVKLLSSEPMSSTSVTDEGSEFDEMFIACSIVNESLYEKNTDKKKVHNSFQLIQEEWSRLTFQKEINGRAVENFLNSIKEHFSNFLLERIVNIQNANGNTALHFCVTNGHWHVVNMLLDTRVCDVCLQNKYGYTAVMMASVIDITTDEQREVVRRLFRESGNVNVKTTTGNQTALMLAVKHGKIDLVQLLLENGAGVNLQDADGSTALMCAVEHEAFDIIKLILAKPECDVNIADNDGQTAVSIATNKNRKDILVALYAKMKERKGHHPALSSSKTRIPSSSASSRIPALDRSTTSTSTRRSTTETTASSTRRTGASGADSSPTVSKFRRY